MKPYLALRIDVETALGLVRGLPPLLARVRERGLSATVMLPTGPDRSGLSFFRVLSHPALLGQMVRLRPRTSMFVAGLLVADRHMRPLLRACRPLLDAHEPAVHGHDHWLWIHRAAGWPLARVRVELARAVGSFQRVFGPALGFGAPGWVATRTTLEAEDGMGFAYASDCRGVHPFVPRGLTTPQYPVTLPTAEEALRSGRGWDWLSSSLAEVPDRPYSCYCCHAEVEGVLMPDLLPRLLDAVQGNVVVGPLRDAPRAGLPPGEVVFARLPGRFFPVAVQAPPCE